MSPMRASNHPAPVPRRPVYPHVDNDRLPPKPLVRVSSKLYEGSTGVLIKWTLSDVYPTGIHLFDVHFYQETHEPGHPSLWKTLIMVLYTSLPALVFVNLPPHRRYHFIVRAKDVNGRFGAFSDPVSALL